MSLGENLMKIESLVRSSQELRAKGESKFWLYRVSHYSWLDDAIDATVLLALFLPSFACLILGVSCFGSVVSFSIAPRPWPRRLIAYRSMAYALIVISILTGLMELGIVLVTCAGLGIGICYFRKWPTVVAGRLIVSALALPPLVWSLLWQLSVA